MLRRRFKVIPRGYPQYKYASRNSPRLFGGYDIIDQDTGKVVTNFQAEDWMDADLVAMRMNEQYWRETGRTVVPPRVFDAHTGNYVFTGQEDECRLRARALNRQHRRQSRRLFQRPAQADPASLAP